VLPPLAPLPAKSVVRTSARSRAVSCSASAWPRQIEVQAPLATSSWSAVMSTGALELVASWAAAGPASRAAAAAPRENLLSRIRPPALFPVEPGMHPARKDHALAFAGNGIGLRLDFTKRPRALNRA